MREVYINKISAFLPNDPIDNENIEKVLGQVGDRPSRARRIILKSNKIINRYYAIDPKTRKATHTNTQLTAQAIRGLQKDGLDLDSVDVLACGTTLPDQLMPNHAIMVHGELGCEPLEVVSTAGICLSGITALKYAYTSIKSGDADVAIATGSENSSAIMRAENFTPEIQSSVEMLEKNQEIAFEKDFLRWMLSDGAGAMALSAKPNETSLCLKIDKIFSISYANVLDTCMYGGCEKLEDGSLKGWGQYTPQEWLNKSIFSLKQDVKLLNDNIVEYTVAKPLTQMLEKKMFKPEEIDWFLPHYSSNYFRDEVYKKMIKAGCDIPQEKWFTNLSSKGNTGSASIYIMLEELFNSNKVKKGDKLLCYIPESGRFSTAFMLLEAV
ncbi:3-oxoacyl-[acyl-carrier-protein] synthase III [Sulfurimonas gotlandica GD1]|uniref:3-oxoacyl-[acyl-carrier-protein] synthase III n=1 Tax=Sulfurimonas gotlandica (strain DSM 19862 / JCM 16533 / GD1) TaxID=929558 RepID=B6BHB6_SULGG|nr:3-oxoacyl-(acyl carrier protein) synthase [Sulfurimonas gotlandica GD1]EHP29910.1 3-oxoacyl-[acyl-carrier-protein] synthase III [Sulfurimonas gotlandica GD1]